MPAATRNAITACAADEVADPHEQGGEPGQQNGGTQIVHGSLPRGEPRAQRLRAATGSTLCIKCWVGRVRLREPLCRATRQALIGARQGTSRGNGRSKIG